ncbi:RNA degradosome polyphosphate kinase [Litorimonas sp. WD9-15]|uniref:RNA degradosome polyphosphate kinase n=1 Tax=Litorimonas sp. WD9-15 TaxID=3418716 RepID=UPI003D090D70
MKKSHPSRLFNRELSWLFFNTRVLEEAENPDVPLLERVRFLSISAANLDEFYMVRVAGLRSQESAGVMEPGAAGMLPSEQLRKINRRAGKIVARQNECWSSLREELFEDRIRVLKMGDLSEVQSESLSKIFETEILPLLTPLSIDPTHPFPFLPNLGFGVALRLEAEDRDPLFAVLPVPLNVPRFIKIETSGKVSGYVAIEDVLRHFASSLFPDFNITETGAFRITRDSGIAVDERAEDLVQHFETLLKQRRRGRVIRLEIDQEMEHTLRDFLVQSFNCDEEMVSNAAMILGLRDVSSLISGGSKDLLFKPFTARFPERIREFDGDCLAAIAAKDILVHHPYEEFDVVIQFLQQAAADPDVVAIKQTLYRTSDNSPIVAALIDAAEAGKNVTALVELKARFDEASNMRWARDLERAGVQVVYGFVGFKTHAKVSLVIRRETTAAGHTLQTYTHLGTGNYHAQNARIYTDLALFTADPIIGEDVGKLFNFVTSYNEPRDLQKLSIAPLGLRGVLEEKIDQEIAHAKSGRPATIWAKMNALVDPIMIEKLYEASQAGVKVDLVVRGICCLRPGIEGLSENIRVKSIIGRFLEHSRIICFGNGHPMPSDQALVYISSADWMPRNLDRRIETLVPVESPTVHNQVLDQIMMANLLDNTNSWELRPTGKYIRVTAREERPRFSAHEYFMENPSLSGRGTALAESAPAPLEDENVPKTQIFRPKLVS